MKSIAIAVALVATLSPALAQPADDPYKDLEDLQAFLNAHQNTGIALGGVSILPALNVMAAAILDERHRLDKLESGRTEAPLLMLQDDDEKKAVPLPPKRPVKRR
jgi:hypothetical protein